VTKSIESRRRFLKVISAGSAVLGVGAVGLGCGDDEGDGTPISGDVSAGNISALPEGTLRAVSGSPVAIGRDAGGVYAMTTVCTHESCDMAVDGTVAATGLTCTCHGSKFDPNGGVTTGPATKPLDHYEVVIDEASGEITIHGDKTVSATARTVVPTPA
jgi:nitrite reductase/ring-hydroxylating ferredoxin subunit